MPKGKSWYTPEFKAEAVALAKRADRSVTQTAKDLGVALESLRKWIKQAELDAGERQDGLTTEEQEELRRLRREVRVLKEERQKVNHAVAMMCRVLGVSSSGYHAWRWRGPSARAREDAVLTDEIVRIHTTSRQTYRALRIHAELRAGARVVGSGVSLG